MFVVTYLIQTFTYGTLVCVSYGGRSITRKNGNINKTFEPVQRPTKTCIESAVELFQNISIAYFQNIYNSRNGVL